MKKILSLSKPKYIKEKIQSFINNQNLKPGDKILSQNKLAKMYKVTAVTVTKALNILIDEGVLYRIKGSGTFINENYHPSKVNSICLVMPEAGLENQETYKEGWHIHHQYFNALVSTLGENGIASLVIIPPESSLETYKKKLTFFDTIFFPAGNQYKDIIIKLSSSLKKPIVALSSRINLPCLNVFYDRQEQIQLGIKYLINKGYKKIGFAGSSSPEEAPKYMGYCLALENAGIELNPLRVYRELNKQDNGPDAVKILLNRNTDFDAIFFDTDRKANSALNYLRTQGISIPEDIAIMGHEGVPWLTESEPFLSSVGLSYPQMVKVALDEIKSGNYPENKERKIELSGFIIEGKTT